jgi:acyl-coenzyme A synthetase/AMP-(fatty) acid ligase
VLEVAVVARKHDKFGERPMAYVMLRPDYASKWHGKDFESELKQFSRSRLPGFARPGEIFLSRSCLVFEW